MKQVKIIADSNYSNLEKKINEFLRGEYDKVGYKEQDINIQIVDSDTGNLYIAVIEYYMMNL